MKFASDVRKRVNHNVCRLLLLCMAVITGLGFYGCAGQRIQSTASTRHGAIVGNIQVPDGIKELILYELGTVYVTPFKNPPSAYVDDKGNFIFTNLSPGKYYLSHWTGGDNGRSTYKISVGKDIVDALLTEVRPGEIVYTGSFAAEVTRRAFIVNGQFDFNRVAEPTERKVLQDLLPQTEGTGWDDRIESRLKELSQQAGK